MKKEIQEILDNIQYDDFYQKTFESSKNYKTLVCELNYAERCHNLEEELGCSLDVVFKLLKKHMYYAEKPNHKGKLYTMGFPHIMFVVKGGKVNSMEYYDNSFIVCGDCYDFFNRKTKTIDGWDVNLKDYKKTWWLRKDKSE